MGFGILGSLPVKTEKKRAQELQDTEKRKKI
jgi:hypothetical protein